MGKKWFKKVFGMFGGAMVGISSFGANLQAEATSATPITKTEPTELAAEGQYCIGTIDGFLHFRDLVNEGKVGGELKLKENGEVETDSRATITLTTSLDLTEKGTYEHGYCDRPKSYDENGKITDWYATELDADGNFQNWKKTGNGGGRYTPIGKYEKDENGNSIAAKQFRAKFDGGSHEIKLTINIVAESVNAYAGVFGYVNGGEIKNLGVAAGSYISASATTSKGSSYAGGILGGASGTTAISGCYNTGEVSASSESSSSYAGGIAGYASGAITRCYNTGEVSASSESSSSYAGGIAGWADGATITGCYNTGEVSVAEGGISYAGGIAGWASGGTISGCYNTGSASVSGGDSKAGGIAGWASGGTISGCYNTGEVSATATASNSNSYSYAGGIAGEASGAIAGCYNTGEIKASGDYGESKAGGIAGGASGKISGCYNTGAVKSSASGDGSDVAADAGGIVGVVDGTVSGCYNTGTVKSSASGDGSDVAADAGGIAGWDSGTTTISGCYYLNADGMVRGVGNNASYDDGTRCIAKKLEDMKKDGFADKLNAAIAKFEEGKEDEYKIRPEGGDVFVHVSGRTPELWWKVALDNEKAQALAAVDSIKAEIAKLSQLYEVSVDEKLKSLLDGIKVKIVPAATVEQVGEQLQKAQGVLTDFRTKLKSKDCNLGHTCSGIGGQAGFYKASNGQITFRVVPNPGYKISKIITSGSRIIKPGDVMQSVPERVMVNFEKV